VLYGEVLCVDNACHDVKEDWKSGVEDPCGPRLSCEKGAASENNRLLVTDEVIFVV
jgi:hypothetical protein